MVAGVVTKDYAPSRKRGRGNNRHNNNEGDTPSFKILLEVLSPVCSLPLAITPEGRLSRTRTVMLWSILVIGEGRRLQLCKPTAAREPAPRNGTNI